MNPSSLGQLAQQEKTRREILHKSDLIPPLPDLVAVVLSALNRQETEPQDLEQLMRNDQVLVAKMLAMVNSPFYGMSRTIRTVREAVMVLGFRGVRSLVLATSTAKFLQRDYSCYGHDNKGLWVHAVCVAAGAKALALECRMGADAAEQLFVAGLLHDIGKMLLVNYLAAGRTPYDGKPEVAEFERRVLGIDHAEAGALVAAKWSLASDVQDVIKAHHDAAQAPVGRAVAVVRLADAVAHECGAGYLPGRAPVAEIQTADLEALALTAAAWSSAREAVAERMDEATAVLANLST
ncbi:MAG: HDOD domain-containing protein [Planctomycetes bacterium]|nr:HDOD domain-containing protein [Planctomycetota bacterium]